MVSSVWGSDWGVLSTPYRGRGLSCVVGQNAPSQFFSGNKFTSSWWTYCILPTVGDPGTAGLCNHIDTLPQL